MDIAVDLACALDPALWAERVSGFKLDPWQKRALRSHARQALWNCARQSGKSTVAALLALHRAIYKPGSLTLLLSPSLRQSAELFRKVAQFYSALGYEAPPADAESALRLELANGSRIVSLPGKAATIRGYSRPDLIIFDEAARCPDELYYSVRPMRALGHSQLVALSTPFGTRGWWWEAWERGGDEWERITVDAYQCPRISEEFLARERDTVGQWWFEQEYLCRFLDAQTQLFAARWLQEAFEEVETWEL